MTDLGIVKLKLELPLNRWLKCMCGHRWDRYPADYVAEISGRTPEGDVMIKFDCPVCHSWLITQDYERPEGVPEDWILVTCEQLTCDQMVWVPPDWLGIEVENIRAVCSAECATALMRDEGAL